MSKPICSNPLCKVTETQKCVDGLATDKCSKFGKSAQIGESLDKVRTTSDDISIANGTRMNVEESERLLRTKKCDVIAFVGPNESGKTSLIASMYDVFQRPPFVEGFSFVSSLTMFSFEQLLHLSRAISGGRKPEIPHTSIREGLGFYHLSLKNVTTRYVHNLVLIDRAGEEYKSLKDKVEAAQACGELKRAQLVILLVDGKKMLNIIERQNVMHDVKQTLNALVETKLVEKTTKVAVTLTKYDVISAASREDLERVEKDFSRLVASLEKQHPQYFPLQVFKVAALPENETVPQGFGFEGLFRFLLEEHTIVSNNIPQLRSVPTRAFARMGMIYG